MALIRFRRGTRAEIDAAATAGELHEGEPGYITDDQVYIIGTSTTTYIEFPDLTELSGYTQAAANETITGSWSFSGGLKLTSFGATTQLQAPVSGGGMITFPNATGTVSLEGHTHTLSNITDAGTAAGVDTGTGTGQVPLAQDLPTIGDPRYGRLAGINDWTDINRFKEEIALGDIAVSADYYHTIFKRFDRSAYFRWSRGVDNDAQIGVDNAENLCIAYDLSDLGSELIFKSGSTLDEVVRITDDGNIQTANVSRIQSDPTSRGGFVISATWFAGTAGGHNRPVTYGNNLWLDSAGAWQKSNNAIGGSAIVMGADNGFRGGMSVVGLLDTDDATVDVEELLRIDGATGDATVKGGVKFTGKSGTLDYDEDTVTLGGHFDAGQQVKCVRIGSQVTITSDGLLTHSSQTQAVSNSGVIPAQYRPTSADAYNVYERGIEAEVGVNTNGFLFTNYNANRTNTVRQFSITYNIT